jgi:hypothetical protein
MRVDIKDAHYGNNVIYKIYYGSNLVYDRNKIYDLNQNVYIFDLSKVSNNYTLTLQNVNNGTYTDWGDGVVNTSLTHTYSHQGVYTVKTRQVIQTPNGGDGNTEESLINCINIDNSINDCSSMFAFCTNLTDVRAIPSNVVNCKMMFVNTKITVAPSIPSSVTNCSSMFAGCSNLTTIPQSNINLMVAVKNGTNTTCTSHVYCYNGCTNINNPQTYATLSGLYPNWFTSFK